MHMLRQNPESFNVLMADDDDDDFLVFSMAISEIPYKILLSRVEDGEKLMHALQEKTPDILFLDLHMPCKDGTICLKEIRQNHQYDTLPVIVYSSLDDVRNIEICFRQGANLYVIKPNSFSQLKEMLERIITIDWRKAMVFPTLSNFVLRSDDPT